MPGRTAQHLRATRKLWAILRRPAAASAACEARYTAWLHLLAACIYTNSVGDSEHWCLLLHWPSVPRWRENFRLCETRTVILIRHTASDSGLSGLSSSTRMLWQNSRRYKETHAAVDRQHWAVAAPHGAHGRQWFHSELVKIPRSF